MAGGCIGLYNPSPGAAAAYQCFGSISDSATASSPGNDGAQVSVETYLSNTGVSKH